MADNQIQWSIILETDGLDSAMSHIQDVSNETTRAVSDGWTMVSSTASGALKNLSSRSEETAGRTKEQIDKAAQSVSTLADLIGIAVPASMQKLVASSELLGPALAKAFPVLTAILLIKKLYELYQEHKRLTAAIYGQSAAWRTLDADVSRFSDDTHIRLLELQERIDGITAGPLAVLKDKLQLIDAESFEQLKPQFQRIADDANKAFADMKENWFKAFLFGETDAQDTIKAVNQTFGLIMDRIQGMEKAGNMAGIGQLLDAQIAKTKERINEDQRVPGTGETPQIIAAYQRLLNVLLKLKDTYSDVQQVAAKEKKLVRLEPREQPEHRVQVITLSAQKDRIRAVRQANQEELTDYQQTFAGINASAQQFNNQQLTILMGGIGRNSAQIIHASQQRFKKLEAEEAASLERRRKAFDRVFKGISGVFDTFVHGLISGNETLGQAWDKMVNEMASKFLSGLEHQLMGFLEHKLMELSIHTTTETAKDAASKAVHAKEDKRTAYSAAKGAWESTVHIPIVGPILAPIAAATTFAAVTAFGSAEGGQYLVPSEQLTMLHRNEMVLPAGVAQKMRGVIDSGGEGGITVVVNHSVNAVDAESFQSHVRRHANMIGNEVARALRKKKLAS